MPANSTIRMPERNKKPGVSYVVTDQGVELPVVDITNPAFEPDLREETVPAFLEATTRHMEEWARLPGFARRLMSGRSIFTDQTSHQGRGFVSGMTTYLMKLGAANLGVAYARKWDYTMARSLPMVSVQMRLRAVARLMADGLAGPLCSPKRRGRSLELLNLAGGSAADSWNTLLLIRKEHPEWLAERPIRIRVLDLDATGPRFGGRVVAKLLEDAGPLCGLRLTFEYAPYDWSKPETLRTAIGDLDRSGDIVACSSEGGLLEYGSDTQIVSNLYALEAALPPHSFLVGSLFRNERLTRAMKRISAMTYMLREEQPFDELVGSAGWSVAARWNANPVYWAVRLEPARAV